MASERTKKSAKVAPEASAQRAVAKAPRSAKTAPKSPARKPAKPVLLSGGNPQIAKADGDAPVRAYIAAMPGWKQDVGRRLDALIVRTVPAVQKAMRWNSPFYGIEGRGWFLGLHCITKYVKVAFFKGTSLQPLPRSPRRTRARATFTSSKAILSTRNSLRVGFGKPRNNPDRTAFEPLGVNRPGSLFVLHASLSHELKPVGVAVPYSRENRPRLLSSPKVVAYYSCEVER